MLRQWEYIPRVKIDVSMDSQHRGVKEMKRWIRSCGRGVVCLCGSG